MDKDNKSKSEFNMGYYIGIGFFNSMLKKDLISQTEYDNMTMEFKKQVFKSSKRSDVCCKGEHVINKEVEKMQVKGE